MTERTEHALPELAMVLEQEPNYPWHTKIVPASLSYPECIAHLPVGTVLCSRAAAVKRIAEVERERDALKAALRELVRLEYQYGQTDPTLEIELAWETAREAIATKGVDVRLAKMLRLYLAAEGLEQRAVAVECGVSETTLSRFLAGDRLPDAAGFARIQAWCASVVCDPVKRPFDPNARIGGPDAPYRREPQS